ncbi:MAG: non-heme iron oxygenase ferredoxin subunit [Chloroflexota bacterium]|nr:non-heme iron oxygenase ferredoxin subunit [Chloroflexota bacterium]
MSKGKTQELIDSQKWLDVAGDAIQPVIRGAFSSAGEAGKVAKDLLNGVWLGHPLHPTLVAVPVGAWTMTQLFDLMSALRGNDESLDAASDIALGAGVVSAVAAAVAGIADWSDTGGPQKRMGLAHGLLNVVGLGLNVGSLALRRGNKNNRGLARTLSASGYMVSGLAAFVAGELVYNLGQAVNRDAWVEGPGKFTDVAAVEELQDGKMVRVDVEGRPIVLLQHEDGIHAFEGTCPHFGGPLWEGKLEGHIVTCPWHASEFDVSNGDLCHGPATSPIPTYDVRKRAGRVQIRLKA